MEVLVYMLIYALIGLGLGELYLHGSRKVGHRPNKQAYVIGMTLWPMSLVLWFVAAYTTRMKP